METSRLMNNRRSFIIGIKSTKLNLKEKNFLLKYKPWGVILFTRNIKDIKQAKQLTTSIRKIFNDNKYPILIAPGENEIKEAERLNAKVVLENRQPINIKMLISLINKAHFIVSNDTGPAHIASHLNKNGLVLFGSHTSAKKVSIERENFNALSVKNLVDLSMKNFF